jgi:hypothetical protein
MTNQHPITPPPELVQQWLGTYFGTTVTGEVSSVELALATQAVRWGADQELEACCSWLIEHGYDIASPEIRAARRPKPPTLKEEALDELASAERLYPADWSTIRRALEALPND